jgi:hypothetical protein
MQPSGRVIRRLPFSLLPLIVIFSFLPAERTHSLDRPDPLPTKLEVTRSVILPVRGCHKLVVRGLKKVRVGPGLVLVNKCVQLDLPSLRVYTCRS